MLYPNAELLFERDQLKTKVDILVSQNVVLANALRQWMCPACGGSKVYTGFTHDAPFGSACRKCADTDGLNPIAFAALKTAIIL